MKCAIYARHSSDMQKPQSIEDQVRQCREVTAQRGWQVSDGHIFSDSAVSGANDHFYLVVDELSGELKTELTGVHGMRVYCILIDVDRSVITRGVDNVSVCDDCPGLHEDSRGLSVVQDLYPPIVVLVLKCYISKLIGKIKIS